MVTDLGNNTLHLAAESGNEKILEFVIQKVKGKMINTLNNKGVTPLLIAVKKNFVLGVALLLQVPEIDVNIPDKENYTPVSIAAQCGYIDILRLLIDCKANLNEESAFEESPLLLALENNFEECAIELLQAGVCFRSFFFYLFFFFLELLVIFRK